VIKVQPFHKIVWNIDIDTLTAESPAEKLSVKDLVTLAAFKTPGIKVLDFGGLGPVSMCEATDLIDYTVTVASESELERVNEQISTFEHAAALKIDPTSQLEAQGLQQGQFDLILPGSLMDAAKLSWLLSPTGRVIADSKTCASLGENFAVVNLASGLAIATAKDEHQHHQAGSIVIVYRNKLTEIPDALSKTIQRLGFPRFTQLAKAQIASAERVILACDLEGSLLLALEANELSGLQNIVSNASSVTWISAGGLMRGLAPEQAMASGFARSVRSEMASLDFTTVDLDLSNTTTTSAVNEVANALERQILRKGHESEYCVESGLVYVSRLVPDETLNDQYGPQSSQKQSVPFRESDKLVGVPKASKLVFTHDERANKTVGGDEVQIRVILTALNKEDVLVRDGTDYPTTFSHEVYGVVTQKGTNVSNLNLGDHVFGFSRDRLATFQTVSADMLQKVAEGDVPDEVVTLPMAYGTAFHGLSTLAKAEAGEIVLILQGSGDAGSAAIALSKLMKLNTYVAVRSEAEAAKVAAKFNLPSEHVIPSLDNNIMTKLQTLTGGQAADVVFSSAYVPQTVAHECWRTIGSFGRFIEIGRKNVLKRSALDTVPMSRGASYMAFDILDLYSRKPHLLSSYLRQTAVLYRQNILPAIGTIDKRNISEYDSAVASFSDDFATKKTVIEHAKSGGLIDVLPRRAELRFVPDATYFLVGCLGGLGRSITAWMAQHGAKRFAFMSRSGVDKEETAVWIRSIEAMGVTCQIIKGDVAKKNDVDAALRSIPTSHPVRGVVHAAMVLRVSVLLPIRLLYKLIVLGRTFPFHEP
jgi:NADPH:quinone reductase-like Zn-dependent oxidoreductase